MEHLQNLGPDVPGARPVRALFGGIAKDGPEDRGLSERCVIGFNAGPPIWTSFRFIVIYLGVSKNFQFTVHQEQGLGGHSGYAAGPYHLIRWWKIEFVVHCRQGIAQDW